MVKTRGRRRVPMFTASELKAAAAVELRAMQVEAQLAAATNGLDDFTRAQVTAALRPALEQLATFKDALRAELGDRGLVPSEAKTKTTKRRRRRPSEG